MSVFIYHITHINNLPSIVQHNGLYSDNYTREQQVQPQSIAHQHIKERRAQRQVPVAAGGTLADYVPFYFAPRSPMLYAIHQGHVAVYNGGQNDILHLVTTVKTISLSNQPFVFTNGHADIEYSQFFENLAELEHQVDWNIMKEKYWYNTKQDGDRVRRRQAEFLVYQYVPWTHIHWIGVIDRHRHHRVEILMEHKEHRPKVFVRRNWYY